MLIIPAIDLIDGKCVRLTEGDYNQKKEYEKTPVDVARQFKEMGATRIHIIDLDGAKSGNSTNRNVIKKIKKETGLIIETGGGIRTEDDVKELLDGGIDHLILGTILVKAPDMVHQWLTKYGNSFIAGIDAKDRTVRTAGWLNDEGIPAVDFGKKMREIGFTDAIYTDISRDGKLSGANLEETVDFAENTGLKVILSGGITTEDEIEKAATFEKSGIIGTIIGKAYYEGKIDLEKILKKFGG